MLRAKPKKCKSCGYVGPIFSKGECKRCANRRYKSLSKGKKRKGQVDQDTEFYHSVWGARKHKCEECDKPLGNTWKRHNFSHHLSKGAFPQLRRVPENIDLLCFKCHQEWEFGDKRSMKIYSEDRVIKLKSIAYENNLFSGRTKL